MGSDFPDQAQIVIIGGGVVGCSVAYHLAELGVRDVVLLERKSLTSGTTWHAAGLVGQLRATQNLTRLAQYTTNLYADLEKLTGQATGFRQNGSLSLATDDERFEELKRGASMASCFGLEVEVVSPKEALELYPIMSTKDLVGAVFLPRDGQTNPTDTTQALARGARDKGVRILEGVSVESFEKQGGRISSVMTSRGPIACETVVNCAGMWGRSLGLKAGVSVPLHAAEHFYVVTEPIPDLQKDLPVVREPSACNYYKEDAGKMMVGMFEPVAKPWGMHGIPEDFEFGTLPEDVEHIEEQLNSAIQRIPVLGETGIKIFFNGPESFTPDNRYWLGPSIEVPNFFLAAGFNSIGIQSAGGAGKVLAEWIVNGDPPMDLWDVDARRMMPFQVNREYLHDRTVEALGLLYAMHWPFRQPETARGVRTSVLHQRLTDLGACFGETAGWERANWFAPKGVEPVYEYSYGRQNWFDHSAREHRSVRENVGVFDMSSFGKYLVQGRDACQVLERVSANRMDVDPGRVVYTQWLNDDGGIEADLTVTRLSDEEYLVVTAAASQTRDLHWLKSSIRPGEHVFATDVTSAYSVLSVMGPRSREMLQTLTPTQLSSEAFPFGTSQEIEMGYALVRATRISYVGELGWEIYVPSEFTLDVFDRLADVGQEFQLQPAGLHALNSLRIEKAYRHWGHDIGPDDNPFHAGLGFAVDLDKPGGFRGRDALLRAVETPLRRRLVQFLLQDPTFMLYHEEPIWRDGVRIGRTTSGMYGHTLGGCVGLGYVECDEVIDRAFVSEGSWEIEIAGERVSATASLSPMYDPRSERIKT
ncbi:MAG: FAD-dependent oxidoreductase [Candidatus Thioglobus sp.]|nr:MAG: FAD-dependent oxidoreductase [Candidatus Thioglobus sp.]